MTQFDEPNRILIVRPSALGDVCRTVPVLVSLRQAYPNALINWVVQEEFVGAVAEFLQFSRLHRGIIPQARRNGQSDPISTGFASSP